MIGLSEQERRGKIYTDGAARGNPGKAAWAYLIVADGELIASDSGYLGITTNNVAEYHAVINGMRAALDRRLRHADLCSDSELVVRQIGGKYRVRAPHLRPLHQEVLRLKEQFTEIRVRSVPRDHPFITRADAMCNAVLDREAK
ncbi:MAG: ribonuclease HI family protein [Methanomicrobiaceae archaeon]|nr:ribonuclease HI family protein [Methanomicrobiaceae archaeon]